MSELYNKIPTVFKRQEERPFSIIEGSYQEPEFEYLQDAEWTFTEKVDGTNTRIIWDGHRISYGGRTEKADMPQFIVDRLDELFAGPEVEQVFEQIFGEANVIIFGEMYGEKIQKVGANYREGQGFTVFDVKIGDIYLERNNMVDIAIKLGLEYVPVIFIGTLRQAIDLVKRGLKSEWGNFTAEGLVGIPSAGLLNRKGGRIITKIKDRDFN